MRRWGKDGDADSSIDRVESDKDMTLVEYQKDAKADMVARRRVARIASRAKKWRNSPY